MHDIGWSLLSFVGGKPIVSLCCSPGRTGRWGGRSAKLARIQEQEKALADLARKKLGLEALDESISQAEDGMKKKEKGKKESMQSVELGDEKKVSGKRISRKERKLGKENKKKKIRKLKEKKQDAEQANNKSSRLGSSDLIKKESKEIRKGKRDGEESTGQRSGLKKVKGDVEGRSNLCTKMYSSVLDQCACVQARKGSKKVKHLDSIPEISYPDPTPASGWWGASRFISSGFAGQVKEVVPLDRKERLTFDEEDQVKVYMFAHNAKRKGKVGLGH